MKISVFTPTHDTTWIYDPYISLVEQTVKEWEWVIVPNGKVTSGDIPEVIKNDPRVKIISTSATGIGALKHFACINCSGDLMVELDHDDQLTANCLERLQDAWEKEPHAFYYSDFVNAIPGGDSEIYSEAYGWMTYPFMFNKIEYKALSGFPATARALCQIFYAPNHIRAWSQRAYAATGGHNVEMAVADDHELLCRTYIAGIPFVQIPEVLYIYSRRQDNSFLKHNTEIQRLQQENMNKYMYPLIVEEANRSGLPLYDIVGPSDTPAGFQRLTMAQLAQNKWNIPLSDDSVSVFRAQDSLQFIPRRYVVQFMNSIWRVLRPGGWVLIRVPSTDGRAAWQDPNHKSFWNENSFWYYLDRTYAKNLPEWSKARFQAPRLWTAPTSDLSKQHNMLYTFTELCALKGQRQAGLCGI